MRWTPRPWPPPQNSARPARRAARNRARPPCCGRGRTPCPRLASRCRSPPADNRRPPLPRRATSASRLDRGPGNGRDGRRQQPRHQPPADVAGGAGDQNCSRRCHDVRSNEKESSRSGSRSQVNSPSRRCGSTPREVRCSGLPALGAAADPRAQPTFHFQGSGSGCGRSEYPLGFRGPRGLELGSRCPVPAMA